MSIRKQFIKCENCSFRSFNKIGQKGDFMAQFPLQYFQYLNWSNSLEDIATTNKTENSAQKLLGLEI